MTTDRKCCCKGCDNRVTPPDEACASCCALLDRLLTERCAERGIDPDALMANLNAYCDDAAKKRTATGPHLIDGEFQSDKYPTCPRGKVPLSVKDPTAQDLLWQYAQRRRVVDAEFAGDLEVALAIAGYTHPTAPERAPLDLAELEAAVAKMTPGRWPRLDENDKDTSDAPVWHGSNFGGWAAIGPIHYNTPDGDTDDEPGSPAHRQAECDARGMNAIVNAAPSLLTEIHTLRDRASLAEGIAESRASHAKATVRARRESEEGLRARIAELEPERALLVDMIAILQRAFGADGEPGARIDREAVRIATERKERIAALEPIVRAIAEASPDDDRISTIKVTTPDGRTDYIAAAAHTALTTGA